MIDSDDTGDPLYPLPGVDLDHPSIARIYDYFLGGTTNWRVDRLFGDRALASFPMIGSIAKSNRVFLHRAVRHLIGLGVTQFIDIGSGVPTQGHTHQIADAVAPGVARVAYVDNDPVAVAHSEILLEEDGDPDRHEVIHADLRAPSCIWSKIQSSRIIDLDQPVALLLIAVLHVRQPAADKPESDIGSSLLSQYRDMLQPHSYLALSHVTTDDVPPAYSSKLGDLEQMYANSGNPVIWRTREEIEQLFGDFDFVEPGLTWTPDWHTEYLPEDRINVSFSHPNESLVLAGVAQKPALATR